MNGHNSNGQKPRALEGIRVLDCSTIIAAPYAAMTLGDFGADVIKIEHPEGDSARKSGASVKGHGLKYKLLGRNKRHMVLNLSTPEGQQIFKDMALKTDVVIENFRPGVMEKWGLGWDTLHKLNPRLIMLRITGFGQFGPYSKRPGFGTLAESMSGFASINGWPDGVPTLPPFGLADSIAALASCYAIMLALFHRERGGEGQMIDTALIEPLFHILGAQSTIYGLTGKIQKRTGNRTANNAPRNTYKTKDDRWVAISTSAQSIAERVLVMVGHPEILDEPWFATGPERAKHADELDAMVGGWIGERSYDDVIKAFEEAGAAVAPIYDISQILEDPQYKALNSVIDLEDEDLGPIKMQNLMFRMSETPGKVRFAGRKLGQDTDAVLKDLLGLSDERIKELHEKGVIEPSAKALAAAAAAAAE